MTDTKITQKSIDHLSNLAKLKLSKDQSNKFSGQIESILDYVEQVSEVEVKADFKSHTDLRSVMREDRPEKSLTQDESVSGRKDKQSEGYFTVKTVISK